MLADGNLHKAWQLAYKRTPLLPTGLPMKLSVYWVALEEGRAKPCDARNCEPRAQATRMLLSTPLGTATVCYSNAQMDRVANAGPRGSGHLDKAVPNTTEERLSGLGYTWPLAT